jgi:DNA (cytosine-5)-methyltransferase 1
MNELALFAGAGGGILGGHLLGWRTVCAVEWEPYAASVLLARQNDGILPPFPIWDDVQTFDGKPWAGRIDVVSGGFPCQDISVAGRGAGIKGTRSGMWGHMARIIGEVEPRYVYVENSPMLTSRGLGTVLGDLASLGFDARWGVVSAADVGAPHQRDRIWIVANSTSPRRDARGLQVKRSNGRSLESRASTELVKSSSPSAFMADSKKLQRDGSDDNSRVCMGREPISESGNGCGAQVVADATSQRQQGQGEHEQSCDSTQGGNGKTNYAQSIGRSEFWATEPNVGRVAHGVAARVDRLKAIGNGQVPAVAATAWRLLNDPS